MSTSPYIRQVMIGIRHDQINAIDKTIIEAKQADVWLSRSAIVREALDLWLANKKERTHEPR